MNQEARYVEDQEPAQPRKQQNYKQDDEHVSLLIFFNSLLIRPKNFRFFQEATKREGLLPPGPGPHLGSSPNLGCAATSAGCPNSSGEGLLEV
jgi:hypothetical protein